MHIFLNEVITGINNERQDSYLYFQLLHRMSNQNVQVYAYTLNILNVQLKIKFPCKIYLEYSGRPLTTQMASSSPNKFTFNQEITIQNQTEKQYIEVIVQLVTEKGAKYVGGVLKFVEAQLIGSEGQRLIVPINKCLDTDAFCQLRVDQVTSSRVKRKVSPVKKKRALKSQYNHDLNLVGSFQNKNKYGHEGQTKSEYNFPLNINRRQFDGKKEPTLAISNLKKHKFNDIGFQKDVAGSIANGPSGVQAQVYKEGYNKLKQKYRKQAETARLQTNKRIALQNNENNLKLQLMRYKLKAEQLDKSLNDKNSKIKELNEFITSYQKQELDSKYLKQEIENKNYVVKNLQETVRILTRDNEELKNVNQLRNRSEQEVIKTLKEDIQNLKSELEQKGTEYSKDLKQKLEQINKNQYEIYTKNEELLRYKCNIEDLQKNMSNKTFQFEKILQSEKLTLKAKIQESKEKINKITLQKSGLQDKIKKLQQNLQEKRSQIMKIQYDKRIIIQNNQSLEKENQQLKVIKEKYTELVREHRLLVEQRNQLEKAKERDVKNKNSTIEQINQKNMTLNENYKKLSKQLQQKYKNSQAKLLQFESQNELLKNQLQKFKRQNQNNTKQINELKNQVKELKQECKDKQQKYLSVSNELAEAKSKSKQGDYVTKIQIDKLKQENEKLGKNLQEQKSKALSNAEALSKLQLQFNKNKMEWQFRQEKALKELGYAKEKIISLETFKLDQESQINHANQTISTFKENQKNLNEKNQKLQLQIIKLKQISQKSKKDIKILQQKLQNSDNNTKTKVKQIGQYQEQKELLEKKIIQLETEINHLKSQLNKEINQKLRNQKINELYQADIAKNKEEIVRLNTIIATRDATQEQLRDDLKKQKEEFTKLDMRFNAFKKETEKFKENINQNIASIFNSINQLCSYSLQRQISSSRIVATDRTMKENPKENPKENAEILNILNFYGKESRNNINKLIQQLKSVIRDNQKLNSEYSTTINKVNTNEFEFNQNINKLQQQISELIQEKQNMKNKFQEEIFTLEGTLKEKQEHIQELFQQIDEMEFVNKNAKAELESFREEMQKKDQTKNKIISELRDQNQYNLTSISYLQSNNEKMQQEIEQLTSQNEAKNDRLSKLQKELQDIKENNVILEEHVSLLKRQLKKSNQKNDSNGLELSHAEEEIQKLKETLSNQQKKSAQLRQFLSNLMKQKEEIIKKQLQKSQQILQSETKLEEINHDNQFLNQELKKYKKIEEEQRETIKKLNKNIKQLQIQLAQEISKNGKSLEKLKQKEKEIQLKNESIAKYQEKIKRQKEKTTKDLKELQEELDETYEKLMNKEKESNEKIILLENQLEKSKTQNAKLKEQVHNLEELRMVQRNNKEEILTQLTTTEKQSTQEGEKIKKLDEKIKDLEEQLQSKEEQNYKLQNKIYNLDSRFQQLQSDKNDKIQNLDEQWSIKFDTACQQYEQKLQFLQKEKDLLKIKLEQREKQYKKMTNELKNSENNFNSLKKSSEEKLKSIQEDRLSSLSQKNIQNQRLIDENRTYLESIKVKQSEIRKLNSDIEINKNQLSKVQGKLKDNEQKYKLLLKNHLNLSEDFKKKEQNFNKTKENYNSSLWRTERQVRRVVQNNIKSILQVVDEQNTMKIIQVTKNLQQSIINCLAIKVEEKE